MMKFILLFVLYLSVSYSITLNCDCGASHVYNRDSNTCIKYPSPNQDGYVEGCQRYRVDGINYLYWRCIECKPQYIFKKNNQCQDTGIPGCIGGYQLGSNQYKCFACDSSNYYLHDNKCQKFPSKGERDYILECEIYSNQRQCIQCQNGYITINNYCQKIQEVIPNCVSQSSNDYCIQCENGYAWNFNDKCLKIKDQVKNCQQGSFDTYRNRTDCSTCDSGYYLNEKLNKCEPYPTSTRDGKIPNCISYYLSNSVLKCNRCDTQYSLKLSRDHCEKIQGQIVENCDSYVDNLQGYQVCSQCLEGYVNYENDNKIYDCKKCPAIPDQQKLQEQQEEELYEFLQNTISNIINGIQKFF